MPLDVKPHSPTTSMVLHGAAKPIGTIRNLNGGYRFCSGHQTPWIWTCSR